MLILEKTQQSNTSILFDDCDFMKLSTEVRKYFSQCTILYTLEFYLPRIDKIKRSVENVYAGYSRSGWSPFKQKCIRY
jgi:hypothetical protein